MKGMASKLAVVALALMVAGCSSTSSSDKDAVKPGNNLKGQGGGAGDDGMGGMGRGGASGGGLGGGGGAGGGSGIAGSKHRIFFDLNSSMISDEARKVLIDNARWVSQSGFRKVIVEGHCDERGTREYNLALGQRRADSVKDFLVSQGVSAGSIRTISFGKEQPLVDGHDEFAWGKNRRAEVRGE